MRLVMDTNLRTFDLESTVGKHIACNLYIINESKIKTTLIPGLIHWNFAGIMESHRIISCHSVDPIPLRNTPWPGVFRAWPVDISGIRMFFLAGPDLFRPFCVSWALEAFRSLSGERDRLGSKDGYGMGGKDANLHGCLLSRFAIDFGSAVNIIER